MSGFLDATKRQQLADRRDAGEDERSYPTQGEGIANTEMAARAEAHRRQNDTPELRGEAAQQFFWTPIPTGPPAPAGQRKTTAEQDYDTRKNPGVQIDFQGVGRIIQAKARATASGMTTEDLPPREALLRMRNRHAALERELLGPALASVRDRPEMRFMRAQSTQRGEVVELPHEYLENSPTPEMLEFLSIWAMRETLDIWIEIATHKHSREEMDSIAPAGPGGTGRVGTAKELEAMKAQRYVIAMLQALTGTFGGLLGLAVGELVSDDPMLVAEMGVTGEIATGMFSGRHMGRGPAGPSQHARRPSKAQRRQVREMLANKRVRERNKIVDGLVHPGREQKAPRVMVPESYMNTRYKIDMRNAPGGEMTTFRFPRNNRWFWRQMLAKHPEIFSDKNRSFIRRGVAPEVDAHWVKHFPQHKSFKGETIEHHHYEQGPFATPLPYSIHKKWYDNLHPHDSGGAQ